MKLNWKVHKGTLRYIKKRTEWGEEKYKFAMHVDVWKAEAKGGGPSVVAWSGSTRGLQAVRKGRHVMQLEKTV
jgi:hypothetical protein